MAEMTRDKAIPEPDLSLPPPTILDKTGPLKGHNGVTFLAGEGKKPSDIMFVTSCVSPQEAAKFIKGKYGDQGTKVQPRYLRSDAGVMFKDIFAAEGIGVDDCYYTAVIKWLLPKAERIKIAKDKIEWALPLLEEEIKEVSPKIIVCIGKPVFDLLADIKLSISDARSGWFYSKKYNCKIYVIDDIYKLVTNPEYIEKFSIEAREISRMHKEITGVTINKIPIECDMITSSNDLRKLVYKWRTGNYKVFSVDCEWAGKNHVDGKLRSTQFAWEPGKAAYIRWMDEKGNYVFDIPYKEAGKILSSWLDNDDVKYIGHHWAADAPWLHSVLGLNWYEKCIFDSEFAQQTVDEASDLSLERLALKYTDLGRYDLDLTLWVKENKALMTDGGYGAIPDEILIPYAIKDVLVVFRAWPNIIKNLEGQDLLNYYNNIFNPFVTDVFTNFALTGLPMDTAMLDELRELYTFARDKMELDLQEEFAAEANSLILNAFIQRMEDVQLCVERYQEFVSFIAQGDHTSAMALLKSLAKKVDEVPKLKVLFDHYIDSPNFNIRSAPHLKRWLFDVKGYVPIKSTSKKAQGMPSTSWEKVLAMPAEARKNYNPAVDKQTLQILAEKENDMLLRKLLQLNAVGNICKAFLKQDEVDEAGNIIKENGLHSFICSDYRIHGNYSCTETGRPRGWKPNALNWPSYVNKMISVGIAKLFGKLKDKNELPAKFERYITKDKDGEYTCFKSYFKEGKAEPDFTCLIPSIRSCVKAPDGWCFVESDYQTAEVRGLAFISGDRDLIDLICNPDLNFAVAKDGRKLRLSLPSNVFSDFSQKLYSNFLTPADHPDLIRDEAGNLKHPKQDLHWALAEMVHEKPREILSEKEDRHAAKTGRFSSTYGASASTVDRKIEQETGKKPPEGTGARILKAIERGQPVAQDFLEKMARIPSKSGIYRAASGRIRHCTTHGEKYMDMLDEHITDGLFNSMGRELRNFP